MSLNFVKVWNSAVLQGGLHLRAKSNTGPNLRNMANVPISLRIFGQKRSDKERVINRSITMKKDQRVRATNEIRYFNLRSFSRNSKLKTILQWTINSALSLLRSKTCASFRSRRSWSFPLLGLAFILWDVTEAPWFKSIQQPVSSSQLTIGLVINKQRSETCDCWVTMFWRVKTIILRVMLRNESSSKVSETTVVYVIKHRFQASAVV
jgi:hypothetical protein